MDDEILLSSSVLRPERKAPRPFVRIVEQPVCEVRFRYPVEGRGAGVVKGENSGPDKATFPKIQIFGYEGPAEVVVSCVTHHTATPRAHPHNLVSPATVNNKEGCRKGVFHTRVNSEEMRVQFQHLGIQCVRKKDIQESLKQRQKIRVDPYKQGFDHMNDTKEIDLNAVFIETPGSGGRCTHQLTPVCSRTIFSARVKSHPQIIDLSDNTSLVTGGKKVILVCERVSREDIKIRLSDGAGWEGWGEFGEGDVHKHCAITFRSPPFPHTNITQPVRLSLELVRPSDGATSEEEEFFYTPLPHTSGGGSSSSNHIQNDLDYDGLELQLGDIGRDLQFNIPVNNITPRAPTLPPQQTLLSDFLDNSETDDNLLNLSDIMKDLGLKPPLNNTKTGMKRSSKDAENDSASLSYLCKMAGGGRQQTPHIHIDSRLGDFLHNCEQINDL